MSAKANYVALSSTKHMELVCLLHDFKMYSLTKELMRFPLKKANFMPTILPLVCYTAVFSVVTQCSSRQTKNGCVADYTTLGS